MIEIGRCTNPCHDAATEDGVDVTDPIEAAVAQGCSCLDDHCPALLDHPITAIPCGDISTAWVDSQSDGEGRE